MEVWQKNFLAILNSAVHHLPVRLEEPADYGKILEIAREQNLLALVCEKLCECESFLRDPV